MARAADHISSLKSNEIPANFQTGIIALKWPEDTRKSPKPTTTHLSIDTKGFYLICHDKVKNEIECFDISLIHDTRTGSQVVLPPGIESFDHLSFGALDVPIKSKWVSIYYGNSFVASNDLRIIHFYFQSPNIAREWAEQLFRYGHNLFLRNLSSLECLEKIHSRILNGLIDLDKKTISVRSLIQFLCKNNRDLIKETKIRQTLEYLKLPYQIDSFIDPKQFTFKKFFRFYMHLMERHEIMKLFDSLNRKHRRQISWENLKLFIKKQDDTNNDPFRMDHYEKKVNDLLIKYTRYDEHSTEKGMSDESFLQYLLSFDNLIINPTILDLYMDMNKPLAHYFIASSHNTYLTGSQFTGRASVEMYRQVLLTGCRCIELDVVDSEKKNDEPEIKHIYTPIKPVPFIEVIVAIREYAFKVTSYPLILSIENHCNPKVQAKMAQYFVDVFGDFLLTEPLNTHPCEVNCPLPSPNDLKYKILIKNKKLQSEPILNNQNIQTNLQRAGTISTSSSSGQSTDPINPTNSSDESKELCKQFSSSESYLRKDSRQAFVFEDEYFTDDDDKPNPIEIQTTIRESKATRAMSDLVNYIVPIRFKTFARAEERNRSFEMSSFPEDKGYNLIRDHPKEFLDYNQRQLSRIYPRGTRFESSNFNPYIFWPVGCQMVALNYQTLDVPMQLNLGLFSFNGACGYIEKPSALCQLRSSFDPRVRTHVENVVSYQIDIKILSGQFLCQDREPTFVDIQMYGMYGDINKRHEYHVRAKRWNGFQAIYDETDVESGEFSSGFSNVILPEMAAFRFSVTAEDGGFLGQSFLPIAHLRSGYRHIVLRNQMNRPVNSSSLFVFIRKSIYINAKDREFADILEQPLRIQGSNLSNEINSYNEFSPNMFVRYHHSLTNEFEENSSRRNSSVLLDETNSYYKHIIAGSELNNRKHLCKILSFNDIHPREIQKREKIIQEKLRRVFIEYQPKIEQEENRFQKSLNPQYSHQDGSIMTNNFQSKRLSTSAINKRDIEQSEQSLLKLYSDKFHQQEELEYKQLNEYYKKLEKEIMDDYNRQINQIYTILKKDKSRVNEYVRSQIKQEANDIAKKETDRDGIIILKQRSLRKNTNVGALTIRMLEDMCEQVKEILQENLQINLNQLEEQKTKEIENCFKKYSDQFNQLKFQLKCQINNDEYDISHDNLSSPYRSRMTRGSVSDVSHYPSEVITLNQQPRRQTIHQ